MQYNLQKYLHYFAVQLVQTCLGDQGELSGTLIEVKISQPWWVTTREDWVL